MHNRDSYDNKRHIGLDVLRIIITFMILIHHIIVHGYGLIGLKNEFHYASIIPPAYMFILNAFCIVAVNCFYWISGYFGIRRSFKKILLLYLQSMVFMTLYQVLFLALKNESISIYFILMPFKDYWFIATYIFLCLFAPYINSYFNSICKREALIIALLLTIINIIYGFVFSIGEVGNGYSVFQALNLYIIGCVCKKYNDTFLNISRKYYIAIYLMSSLLTGAGSLILYCFGRYSVSWRFFQYNNPLIILSSVSLCIYFALRDEIYNQKVNTLISRCASVTLLLYLITDCYKVKEYIYAPIVRFTTHNSLGGVLEVILIFLYAIVIFTLVYIIDQLRLVILKRR